jgi:hypothetical protein
LLLVGLVALLTMVVLPVAAGYVGTILLTKAGVVGTETNLSVHTGPTLLTGHVDEIRFSSTDLDLAGHGHAGQVEIILSDLDLPERTFGYLHLVASDITVVTDGATVHAQTLDADGPASAVIVSGRFSFPDLLAIGAIGAVNARLGFSPRALEGNGDGLVVLTATGLRQVGLAVSAAGDLDLLMNGAPARRLYTVGEHADDIAWQLTGAEVDFTGLTAGATVNVKTLLIRHPEFGALIGDYQGR